MRRQEDDSPPPDNTQIASTPILKERTSVACVVSVLLEQSQEEPKQHSARTTEGVSHQQLLVMPVHAEATSMT